MIEFRMSPSIVADAKSTCVELWYHNRLIGMLSADANKPVFRLTSKYSIESVDVPQSQMRATPVAVLAIQIGSKL